MPLEPMTRQSAGLPEELLLDLILKTIYQRGPQTGYQLGDHLRLALPTIQEILADQRRLHVLEVLGSDRNAFGDGAYIYQLTDEGRDRAQKAFSRCGYIGPAPVPFEEYVASVQSQSIQGIRVNEVELAGGFSDLILGPEVLDEVGPAINSASSVFFYGAAGNGKTSIATRMVRLPGGAIFVPYSIEVEGAIMEFFDPVVHIPTRPPSEDMTGAGYESNAPRSSSAGS